MTSRPLTALAATILVVATPGLVRGQIRTEPVKFAPGASAATVRGTIKGDQTVDYILGAAAGQTMTVTLKTSNAGNYFNVMPTGEEAALFIGSTSGSSFTGSLAASGDYTVRVYLMRAAARRDETASYTITFTITNGPAGKAPPGDAKVKATPYHATGTVPCWVGGDPKRSAQCEFGVIRGSPGNAEVHLVAPGLAAASPGATRRALRFAGNIVTCADPSVRLKATKTGDEWSVSINDREFYQIPEAVILGG